MSADVVQFPGARLYAAKRFAFVSDGAEFIASGTLCGCVDLVTPLPGTLCLTVPEVDSLINLLRAARDDVVAHSDPQGDPRLIG